MKTLKNTIHLIIRSGITGEKLSLPEDTDMEKLYKQLSRHSILALGYTGLVNCGADKKHPVMQQLFRDYIAVMLKSERQLSALKELFTAFEQQGIDYLPLKGINMKKLYPKPELRSMGDADVLIRKDKYDDVVNIVKAQGYEFILQASHTKNWENKNLHLEVHTDLMPDSDEDYYNYFEECWPKAILKNGSEYCFSAEDEFLFIFTHFARHFRCGGIGYRQLIDLWVYTRCHPNLDQDYILRAAEQLKITDFYINVMNAVKVCFEDATADEKSDIITSYILNSGNWGSVVSHTISKGVQGRSTGEATNKNLKIYSFMDSLFPKVEIIRIRYPVLHKHPKLLPFMWIYRIFDALINRQDGIKHKLKEVSLINEDDVQIQQQLFSKIGLDFNF